ncbi:ABC transporter permease [Corynebacterium suedekumii]|uniref:ABC transporter permease n=1 Tax=Corynebacterium suedekumii TaxID=3049801 RepID=A0ABY8VLA0_9CORY|nr:ABC transporter permease [Corynebacterium suedekumii]WIM70425.1 ABC transporter permease [Corynebacterium suedekumii]
MTSSMILRRIGQAVLVLLITYTLAFILLSALPSDGVMARYASPDLALSAEELQRIRDTYGADEPILAQYVQALGGFVTGNFGYSVQTGTAVSTLLAEAIPGTVALALLAFALAVVLALGIAIVGTSEKFRAVGDVFRSLPAFMVSLPTFWLGIVIIQLVSFRLGWVPVIGASTAQALILPTITLSIPIAAPLAQVLIRSIDQVKGQPFIQAVRARGAGEVWIFWRNILRNAMLPALTMAGLLFGELVGGAVVTESVFGRAGLGQMTVQAVANRDTPVLLAVVVIAATLYVLINLIVDLLYPVLDARLRRKVRS